MITKQNKAFRKRKPSNSKRERTKKNINIKKRPYKKTNPGG
jgi:hypothetical protein